jgi:hypothetical protein
MKRKLILLVMTCQLSFGYVFGQGWSQKKNEGFFKLGQNIIVSDQYYSPDGTVTDIRTTGVFSTHIYGELGLGKNWTVIGNIPFFASNTLNGIKFNQSGNEIPSDRLGAFGDIDLAVKYGWFQDKGVVLGTTLLFGIPTGTIGGGESGILQTGDGEFNQMFRADLSFSLYPVPVYFSTYAALNNRTRDFSDEFRYGFDLGYFDKGLLVAFHLNAVNSFFNGSAENVNNGIFSNNMEFIQPSIEVAYSLKAGWGVSTYVNYFFQGQNVLKGAGYGIGIFYKLENKNKQ